MIRTNRAIPKDNLKLLIFDLDGTLVDSRKDLANSINAMLANYQRKTGLPPGTLARSFHWWSDFRSFWFRIVPWHIVVWYAAFTAVVCLRIWRGTEYRVSAVALLMAVQGMLALGFAALGDAGEADRHLWIFHVITDFTIVLAVAYAAAGLRALLDKNRSGEVEALPTLPPLTAQHPRPDKLKSGFL